MAFIASGGYGDAALWLSEGWDWINAHGVTHPATAITHPLYWQSIDGAWSEFSLSGMVALEPDAPVSHVSYFEADAFARWSGARLPTESEWEHAAAACAIEGNFADDGHLRPLASAPEGLSQMFGNVWEWTQSSYAPYPGYRPATGAIGEYNGKFMVNQYVLRGGSCATPRDHIRASYRNFFPATARWQFSGIRLAKDAG
jgi:ergothioneine biosynthesis protein EgtB